MDRYLYEVTIVDKKTDEVLVDKKVPATGDVDAVMKAVSGQTVDQKKVDTVVRKLADLSKEPEVVHVEQAKE